MLLAQHLQVGGHAAAALVSSAHAAGAEPATRPQLTQREQERLGRLADAEAVAFVAGRALTAGLVAEIAGVEAGDVRIEARCPDCGGAHGQPLVLGPTTRARGVRIGIAHAGAFTVAVAAAGRRVGVDSELRAGAASRAQEVAVLSGAPPLESLRHWTRVEAVLKADGRGLRVRPAAVRFEERDGRTLARMPGDQRRYELVGLELHPDLVTSVAIEV